MKKVLSTMVAVAAIYAPLAAHAAPDGTITFTGSLSATTCTINAGQSSFNVDLGSPSIAGLQTAGNTAGGALFSLNLTNCSGGTSSTATPQFLYDPAAVNAQGRLVNTGTATFVDVQLVDAASGNPINVASANQSVTGADIRGGSGAVNFIARFYSTGAAGAGTVASSVTYQINYN